MVSFQQFLYFIHTYIVYSPYSPFMIYISHNKSYVSIVIFYELCFRSLILL